MLSISFYSPNNAVVNTLSHKWSSNFKTQDLATKNISEGGLSSVEAIADVSLNFALFVICVPVQHMWDSASLHEGHVHGILEGRLATDIESRLSYNPNR